MHSEKFTRWVAGVLLWVVLGQQPSLAFGLGPYLSGGAGHIALDSEDIDYNFGGFGFVLDTNIATDRLVNYRAEIGYARGESEKVTTDRAEFVQTVGFGSLGTGKCRLWIGPQLGLFLEGTSSEGERSYIGAEVGPAAGINFQIEPNLSLSISTHARYGRWTRTSDEEPEVIGERNLEYGSEWKVGVNLALLARFGADNK